MDCEIIRRQFHFNLILPRQESSPRYQKHRASVTCVFKEHVTSMPMRLPHDAASPVRHLLYLHFDNLRA